MDALTLHRLPSAFNITFHDLFSPLTMGLALLVVVLKTMALRTKNKRYNDAARFWVTGIPMEFPFGTNWSEFSRHTGGVIGRSGMVDDRHPAGDSVFLHGLRAVSRYIDTDGH